MALVGFSYQPVSLNVNKVCFEEEYNIRNMLKKSRIFQTVTEWCNVENEAEYRKIRTRNNSVFSHFSRSVELRQM